VAEVRVGLWFGYGVCLDAEGGLKKFTLWLGLHSVVDSEKRWIVLRGAVRILFKLLESISGGMDDSRSTWYLLQT
jgi:hypothetical protein